MPEARKTKLPDIWKEGECFIPVFPVEQTKDVLQELTGMQDCNCVYIDDYPVSEQDWVEVMVLSLGIKYSNDGEISKILSELRSRNATMLSAPSLRSLALRDILRRLSAGKKLVLYIRRPISRMLETDFEHLVQYIGTSIGIVCHTNNKAEVPLSLAPSIRYYEMRKEINADSPVYFSYSRDDSTNLVAMICKSLDDRDILYSLDMRDSGVQSSIKEYETAIGNADTVIVVISDKYFESQDCMFEMSGIVSKGDIRNRVVFVSNLKNVKRNNESRTTILEFWKQKYATFKDVEPNDVEMIKERSYVEAIIQAIPNFWSHIVDDVAFLSKDVEKDKASSVGLYMQNLIKQRQSECKKAELEAPNNPVSSGDTPSNTVIQMGNNSITIGTVNGNVSFGSK